jgi:bifunctional non-homologous end joining protein LigD
MSRKPDRRKRGEAHHALVGGWSQQRGNFMSLLLGVRHGRRRKLDYLGEVKTDPNGLVVNFLEQRLREGEIETSPFVEDVPDHPGHRHHWVNPDLVAEINVDEWPTGREISQSALRSVSERSAFRHPRWIKSSKT